MDYEQILFKWKCCHEYKHFVKSCPKKPEKPNLEDNHEEGWNVAGRKKSTKLTSVPQPHVPAKNALGNKFEVFANEDLEIEIIEEEEEVASPREQDPPAETPPPKQIGPRVEAPLGLPLSVVRA